MFLKSVISSLIFFCASFVLANPAPYPVLDGDYRVELTIDGKVFVDFMTLKGKDGAIAIDDFGGDITGTMTVPGMFTSPLTGEGYCTNWGFHCTFDFSIEANENGKTYVVKYTATMGAKDFRAYARGQAPAILTGTAALEDGKVLGTYIATKQ